MTEGRSPGPVRFFLGCDRVGCRNRTTFDLVIAEPAPSIDEDLWGHTLHEATSASPYISELGWIYYQGDGYWCPECNNGGPGESGAGPEPG